MIYNELDSDGDDTTSGDDLPLSTFIKQKENALQDCDEGLLSCLAQEGSHM